MKNCILPLRESCQKSARMENVKLQIEGMRDGMQRDRVI